MLRNSTRLYDVDSLDRPTHLASPDFAIAVARDHRVSSPVGGPIYVRWKGVERDATPFEVEFDGVLEHPYIDSFDAESIRAFTAELESTRSTGQTSRRRM